MMYNSSQTFEGLTFADKKRYIFDEEEFLRVLSLPPHQPDMEFVKKNMFPASFQNI